MKFQSKYPSYKIWIKPSYYKVDASGAREYVAGVFAQFDNGFFETEDKEIIDNLMKNPFYGIDFWSLDEEKAEINPAGEKIIADLEKAKETLLTDCPHCGKTLKTRSALMAHIRFAHSDK